MPFIIRSRSRALTIRDGEGFGDPVLPVGPDAWVPFQHLPRGVVPGVDGDVEVREVDSVEGYERPTPIQAPAPPAPPKLEDLQRAGYSAAQAQLIIAQQTAHAAGQPVPSSLEELEDAATAPADDPDPAASPAESAEPVATEMRDEAEAQTKHAKRRR